MIRVGHRDPHAGHRRLDAGIGGERTTEGFRQSQRDVAGRGLVERPPVRADGYELDGRGEPGGGACIAGCVNVSAGSGLTADDRCRGDDHRQAQADTTGGR